MCSEITNRPCPWNGAVAKSHLYYMSDEPFWYEAQTGIVRDKLPSVSNYHQYKFKGELRPEIERISVQTRIDDNGHLLYTAEQLKWLWDNQESESKEAYRLNGK